MCLRLIVWLMVITASISVSGQKEGFYWYFGNGAGIRFQDDSSDPVPELSSNISTNEGCATISDMDGNLMFYTDGVTVYNRNHEIMSGGTNLYGHASSTQSGVIVPLPNDPDIYYVFTVSALSAKDTTGFRYSIVDFSNSVLGIVRDKNTLLFSETTERITAVKHTNDFGVWVIGHECGSNRFFSYLVTPEGIDPNVIISEVGIKHTCNGSSDDTGKGYLKASPTFNKLAVAVEELGIVQVFDFDRSTGIISNPMNLVFGTEVYGVEFSENAHYLYATQRNGIQVCQWDLQAGTPEQINASKVIVGTLQASSTGALQIAPNGKIYLAVKNKPWLAAINSPTMPGVISDFDEKSVSWNQTNRYGIWGLPTFIQSYFKTFWFSVENQCVGDEIIFTPNTTENLDLIEWDFNDPQSGPNNYSTLFYPVHVYALPGEYTITAKFHYLNTYQTYSKKIEVFQAPTIELGKDTTICEGGTAVFQVDDVYETYLWNGNSCSDHFFEISQQGPVILEVSNVCGMDLDEAFVYVQPLPLVDLGPDIEMKYNEYLSFDPGQYEEYLWMDGSTEKYYSPKNPGAVWVEVSDVYGCRNTDTVIISAVPFTFHVPTAFSPNGDEINEQFKIFTTYDVQEDFDYEFFVFNRWGQEVFHTRNYPDFWDGTFDNLPCPTEVYTWILQVEMNSENDFFAKTTRLAGNVTLLR